MSQKSGTRKSRSEKVVKDIRDAQAVFSGRQDQDRAGRIEGRGQHCRAVPPRGHYFKGVSELVG